MKKIFIKITCVVVCVAVVFSLGVCAGKNTQNNNTKKLQNISFVTEEQINQWKAPVKNLVAELKKQEVPNAFSMNAFAYALFDVNLDGVPELIQVKPGGSAGNVYYEGYDIYSGLCVAGFDGGSFYDDKDRGWCVYYNRDAEDLQNVGISTTRGGADNRFKNISVIEFNSEQNKYDDKTMFYIMYTIEQEIVDDTLVEKNVSAEFYLGKNKVDFDKFNEQYDWFSDNYIRVHESAMELVRVADLEKGETEEAFAEILTEALFSTSQKFVVINNTGD